MVLGIPQNNCYPNVCEKYSSYITQCSWILPASSLSASNSHYLIIIGFPFPFYVCGLSGPIKYGICALYVCGISAPNVCQISAPNVVGYLAQCLWDICTQICKINLHPKFEGYLHLMFARYLHPMFIKYHSMFVGYLQPIFVGYISTPIVVGHLT